MWEEIKIWQPFTFSPLSFTFRVPSSCAAALDIAAARDFEYHATTQRRNVFMRRILNVGRNENLANPSPLALYLLPFIFYLSSA